jgi:hypothetical protein
MAIRNVVLMAALCSSCAASAGRTVAPQPAGVSGEPRASWVISSGPVDREVVVCRSDSEMPCVLEAGTASRSKNVTVSVYLYPASGKTSYKGAFVSAFIGGKGHETKVDYDSVPGRRPVATTTYGLVTTQPGEYEFRMALFAEVAGQRDPYQFEQRVPVRVVPARG